MARGGGLGAQARPDRTPGITGYLRGGLGNQMFIAAAAMEQCRRLGVPLLLDTSFLTMRPQHNGDISVLDHGGEMVASAPRWLRIEPSRLAGLHLPAWATARVFTEASFAYDARIEHIKPRTTLNGYFQSWRYFQGCADELRTRFSEVRQPSEWYERTRDELGALGPWVGLHVRLGDYLDPVVAQRHGVVGAEYVERAVDVVRSLGHGGEVVLFSDDPERARGLHPALARAHVVVAPRESHPIESMVLMSRASALVIANSSFSWWAGYLGHRPGRPVICPRPWFGSLRLDTRDLLLPEWITVERRA